MFALLLIRSVSNQLTSFGDQQTDRVVTNVNDKNKSRILCDEVEMKSENTHLIGLKEKKNVDAYKYDVINVQ